MLAFHAQDPGFNRQHCNKSVYTYIYMNIYIHIHACVDDIIYMLHIFMRIYCECVYIINTYNE